MRSSPTTCCGRFPRLELSISQRLIAGVDVFLLAKNTGTSSDMIERFYGQLKLKRMVEELRPEWRRQDAD